MADILRGLLGRKKAAVVATDATCTKDAIEALGLADGDWYVATKAWVSAIRALAASAISYTSYLVAGSASTDHVFNTANTRTNGKLCDYQNNGSTRFNVDYNGAATFASTVTAATPTAATHLATKAYVDTIAGGKQAVYVRATGNLTLSGTQTIDNVACAAGRRVLADQQTDPTQDGIWVVAEGAWARSADLPVGSSAAGITVWVERGDTYADSFWGCTNDEGSAVVGTDGLTFTQVFPKTVATATTGLTVDGHTHTGPSHSHTISSGTTGISAAQDAHDHGGSTGADGTGATGATAPGLTDAGHGHNVTDPGHPHALTDAGHDHGGSTGADGTGATGASGTDATGTATYLRLCNKIVDAAAAAADSVHAAIASDAARPVTTAITNPDKVRNVTVTFAAGWDGGTVTVAGTDYLDAGITEDFAMPGGGGLQTGNKGFKTVTSITWASGGAGGGNTITVGCGNKLSALCDVTATGGILFIFAAGGNTFEEPAAVDTTNDTFTPATVPDGANDYVFLAHRTHTHTGPSHTHTGPSHSHTISSGTTGLTVDNATTGVTVDMAVTGVTVDSHTHTGPLHSHTVASATPTVNVTDAGHDHGGSTGADGTGATGSTAPAVTDAGHTHSLS